MLKIFLCATWVITALPVLAESTLLDVDLGQSTKELHNHKTGAFDGVVPQDCDVDSPYWNTSVASSKVVTEKGKNFLRVHVEKYGEQVQLSWPVHDLKAPGYYRLSVSFKSGSGNLEMCLRQVPAPYEELWTEKIGAEGAETWCTRTFTFRLDHGSEWPVALFLIFRQTGDYDLGSLKLSGLTSDEYDATVQRPEKGTVNFFRNSRLPLGLQAGWNLDREFETGSVAADTTERGPSGYYPLKLQSDREIGLYSEPFQTSEPALTNSVSLAYKGSGQWRVVVLDEKMSELASKQLAPRAYWKTETMSFSLDERARASRALAFRITGTGTLSIDSFQAWAGTGERPYVSQGECEVALALPDSAISDTRIQFSDMPAVVRYVVSGKLARGTLKMKVFNAWSESKDLPDIQIGVSSVEQEGTASFNVFPNSMLGQFRIEAWVERDGKPISPFNEILITRIRQPIHYTEDAPDSPFGGHFMASPLIIKTMKAAGMNWARLHDAGTEYIGWYHLEPSKGTWTFHDAELKSYRDAHIKIYAGLQTAPIWTSLYGDSGKKGLDGYADRYFQPKNPDDWSNYVRTVTSRYKGVIDDYFIWNEPWGDEFWHTGYDPVEKAYLQGPHPDEDYAKLSIAAYKAAKEGNPAARISGFNTTTGDTGQRWTRGVFDNGAYDSCDVIEYHFYTEEDQAMPGDSAQKGFEAATGYIREKVPTSTKPVYMSEGQSNSSGSSGGVGTGLYHRALTWDASAEKPLLEADRDCRYVVATLATGAAKVFLYTSHGYGSLVRRSTDMFDVLVGPDGYPHVELAAYSNLTWHLEDKKFVMMMPLGDKGCAYLFEGKTGSTAVLAGKRDAVYPVPVSKDLKVSDLFGNPLEGPVEFKGYLLYVDSGLSAKELAGVLAGK